MVKATARSGDRSARSALHLFLCVVACIPLVGEWMASRRAAQPPTAIPALQETPAKSYRAFRRMHATNEKFNQEGWLECWTELDERGLPV